jgi:hypothetical protein
LIIPRHIMPQQGVNCCVELRALLDSGPDGGSCPPVGTCRGFEGTCGAITAQFKSLSILPDYPDGLADYVCHAFPDDDAPVDSFIVGLISIAIALPVTLFLQNAFAIANDSEAPESWLEWVGWRKLVFGLHANRKWHYTGPLGQPNRHVKWFIRSVGAPQPETILNLWESFKAWLTCSLPPWTIEAREVAEEEAAEAKCDDAGDDASAAEGSISGAHSSSASTSSSVRSARALARYKRIMTATGFVGTYICWAVFAWCVACGGVHRRCMHINLCASSLGRRRQLRSACSHAPLLAPSRARFIFIYGMLIYKLLGDEAQQSFARSWGVSYGMNAAGEWKGILEEALKGAVILAILERLCLTHNTNWLEARLGAAASKYLPARSSTRNQRNC